MTKKPNEKRVKIKKANQPTQENNTRGEKHILFKETVPKFKIEMPVINRFTLYLSTFEETKVNLALLLNDIQQAQPNDLLRLIINSPGGLISEGRALINTMLSTGAEIHTELVSQGASMAAVLFCIGDKRVIYENSSIMFHTFSSDYAGKGEEIESYIKHTSKNLDSFFRSFIIGLTEEEIKEMKAGKDFWFDAKEMCERGIATHVNIEGLLIPAEDYLRILKKTKKAAKKMGVKVSTLMEAARYEIDVASKYVENIIIDRMNLENRLNELFEEMI